MLYKIIVNDENKKFVFRAWLPITNKRIVITINVPMINIAYNLSL